MEGMSEREYSAHSGLSRGAIQKARKASRLVVYSDGSINAAASDVRRADMTRPRPAAPQHRRRKRVFRASGQLVLPETPRPARPRRQKAALISGRPPDRPKRSATKREQGRRSNVVHPNSTSESKGCNYLITLQPGNAKRALARLETDRTALTAKQTGAHHRQIVWRTPTAAGRAGARLSPSLTQHPVISGRAYRYSSVSHHRKPAIFSRVRVGGVRS